MLVPNLKKVSLINLDFFFALLPAEQQVLNTALIFTHYWCTVSNYQALRRQITVPSALPPHFKHSQSRDCVGYIQDYFTN